MAILLQTTSKAVLHNLVTALLAGAFAGVMAAAVAQAGELKESGAHATDGGVKHQVVPDASMVRHGDLSPSLHGGRGNDYFARQRLDIPDAGAALHDDTVGAGIIDDGDTGVWDDTDVVHVGAGERTGGADLPAGLDVFMIGAALADDTAGAGIVHDWELYPIVGDGIIDDGDAGIWDDTDVVHVRTGE